MMMQISDFDYPLPSELIAQRPLAQRATSRLLACTTHTDTSTTLLQDRTFSEIVQFLKAGDVLVFNDTKVIPARLFAQKSTGGKVEVLIERILNDTQAWAHIKASKASKLGTVLQFADAITAIISGRCGPDNCLFELDFVFPTNSSHVNLYDYLEASGELPLPPYIQHRPDANDQIRYQTVYATHPGAVAAPTAGLHFDAALLEQLATLGVQLAYLTLHVGAGTFQPVRVTHIHEHRMHREWYNIPATTVKIIRQAKLRGNRIIAVGTTSLRTLEAASSTGELVAGNAETEIFITPGYQFKLVDALITNFHLPKSTLLMLVAAFIGLDTMRAAYQHAIAERYRFFSYGDAMYLERRPAE